jgi:hypothetical protein
VDVRWRENDKLAVVVDTARGTVLRNCMKIKAQAGGDDYGKALLHLYPHVWQLFRTGAEVNDGEFSE